MHIDEIRKGFRGFRKDDVFEYIAGIEKEYSRQVAKKEAGFERNLKKYEKRIAELTEKLKEAESLLQDQEEKLEEYSKREERLTKQLASGMVFSKSPVDEEEKDFSENEQRPESEERKEFREDLPEEGPEEEWEQWLDRKIQENTEKAVDPKHHNMKLFKRRQKNR